MTRLRVVALTARVFILIKSPKPHPRFNFSAMLDLVSAVLDLVSDMLDLVSDMLDLVSAVLDLGCAQPEDDDEEGAEAAPAGPQAAAGKGKRRKPAYSGGLLGSRAQEGVGVCVCVCVCAWICSLWYPTSVPSAVCVHVCAFVSNIPFPRQSLRSPRASKSEIHSQIPCMLSPKTLTSGNLTVNLTLTRTRGAALTPATYNVDTVHTIHCDECPGVRLPPSRCPWRGMAYPRSRGVYLCVSCGRGCVQPRCVHVQPMCLSSNL